MYWIENEDHLHYLSNNMFSMVFKSISTFSRAQAKHYEILETETDGWPQVHPVNSIYIVQ